MRFLLVLLHRYLGLATALFLAMAGLTGSLLAFQHELDAWLNPSFYRTLASAEALPAPVLIERLEAREPRFRIWYMEYPEAPGHSAMVALAPRIDPSTGAAYPVEHKVVYLDPADGRSLGERHWGACCFQAENLVPFVLELHHNLSLPGNWGLWLMGLVAMLWVLDCLVALILTFPRGTPFLGKWAKAWKVKRGSRYRFTFDLHRAGGLWLWLLLLPVAVSSVAMNLPSQVFKPVVSLFSPITPSVYEARGQLPRDTLGDTRMDFAAIHARALQEARRLGIPQRLGELYYSTEYNFFGAGFGDHHGAGGSAWLFFHGTDGRLLGEEIAGRGSLGERFYRLQLPIHGGGIAGLPGRILIAVLGLAIAGLSITGVYIWWRKRGARRHGEARRRNAIEPSRDQASRNW
ncbi:PepSY domain-containing protein [Pseudomonas sp. RIT-PI-AD]|uniref:PepSY-associated TM helix domain-containing protein n=1 Tax=Pseudomonas sp. RIT-PI-AD TaxID=3035294 RepID=UPI0021D9EC83|nr:PepSY domain-containing protein [Pseudomonas sp. RIT-PI-AD]